MRKSNIYRHFVVCLLVASLMFGTVLSLPATSFAASAVQSIHLNRMYNVDVALAVADDIDDIEAFEAGLKAKLAALGVPAERVRVITTEAVTIDTQTASASDIVNGWEARPIGVQTNSGNKDQDYSDRFYINDVDNRVESTNSGRPAAVYLNPDGFNTRNAIIEYQWGIVSAPGSFAHGEAGFVFRMDESRDQFYTYTLDNHVACGNLMNYGTEGDAAEAILKFIDGSTMPSAKSPTADQMSGNDMYSDNTNANPAALALGGFYPYAADRVEYVKIELNGPNIKVYRKMSADPLAVNPDINDPYVLVFDWTDTSDNPLLKGTYGFYVWDQQGAYFSNIKLTTENTKNFTEILHEPNWRDNAKRFVVNLDSNPVSDFDDVEKLSEIYTRMGNEDIHYIGWGTNDNSDQAASFIGGNEGKGLFVNRDTASYDEQLQSMASYIAGQYAASAEADVDSIIVGSSVDFAVDPAELASNTDGKWRVEYDPSTYNSSGTSPSFHGQNLDSLSDIRFEWPGIYEIYFEADLVKTIVVHHKPAAAFEVSVDDATGDVTLLEQSTDPDGKAIAEQAWRWKKTTDDAWSHGQPTTFDPGEHYLIELRVKDDDGEWSLPYVQYVSTKASNEDLLPIAEFTLDTYVLDRSSGTEVELKDTSYDPTGGAVTSTVKVYRSGIEKAGVYDAVSGKLDFTNAGGNLPAGIYKVHLVTQNSNGDESHVFIREIKVIDHSAALAVAPNVGPGIYTQPVTVKLNFDDTANIGLAFQSIAVTNSAGIPAANEWLPYSSDTSRIIQMADAGEYYIHYKAEDLNGQLETHVYGPYKRLTSSGAKSSPPGQPIALSVTDLVYKFGGDLGLMPYLVITQLPDHGVLKYEGAELSVSDVVYSQNADSIVFDPGAWHGITSIKWQGASDAAGTDRTTPEFELVMIINNQPIVTSSNKNSLPGRDVVFSQTDFAGIDLDQDEVSHIRIDSLPDNGTLLFNGTPAAVGQVIPIADANALVFQPNPRWRGTDQFQWSGFDGFEYSATPATLTIRVSSPPAPAIEQIEIDVHAGSGDNISNATIKRTTDPNNGLVTDEVTFSKDYAEQAVNNLQTAGSDIARIVIPDPTDKVSETIVNIPQDALDVLARGQTNLEMATAYGRVIVPYTSFSGLGGDLYFRIVPIKSESEKEEVIARARREQMVRDIAQNDNIRVLGRPMTIETNMKSQPVKIILPLYDRLPEDPGERQHILDNLVIFIEHEDDTKDLTKGVVTNYDETNLLGIEFDIDKFSIFTMVYMEGWAAYLAMLEGEQIAGTHTPYISGYPDGTFGPERQLTRAEAAALLARNMQERANKADAQSFGDVHVTHWASAYIEQVTSGGLMEGYPDGNFYPDRVITRAEMAVIAYKWKALSRSDTSRFADTATHWAEGIIGAVNQAGIMAGYPDGSFKPNQGLTRAEGVRLLNNLLERGPLQGVTQPSWPDVSKTHWAFEDIEEASMLHDYLIDDEGQENLAAETVEDGQ